MRCCGRYPPFDPMLPAVHSPHGWFAIPRGVDQRDWFRFHFPEVFDRPWQDTWQECTSYPPDVAHADDRVIETIAFRGGESAATSCLIFSSANDDAMTNFTHGVASLPIRHHPCLSGNAWIAIASVDSMIRIFMFLLTPS